MDGTTLGTAYVQIVPSTEGIAGELSSALDSAGASAGISSGQSFGSSFGSAMGTAAKVGMGAVTAVGAGVTALGKTFTDSAGSVASYGDDIDKMSQKMGLSAEAYQEWDAVMQHSGTSIDAMARGMTTLSKAALEGDDSFEKLGISQAELKNMSQEELFAKTIEGLQNMESGTERTVLAQKLLGGSSKQLGALLNTSAEDTQAMKERVHELGGVMSDEAVKAAASYQDSLQDMTTAFDSLQRNLTSQFLPSLTGIMDGLTDIFSGNPEDGIKKISEGVSDLISNIKTMLPQVMEAAGAILTAIGQAITENLPQIIEMGASIVLQLIDGFVKALPGIMEAGLQAIVTLAQSIGQALPTLIPAMVDAVLTMVEGLIDNIDLLIDAALQLMIGLAEGLINAIPRIIEKIPVIIEKLVKALVDSAPRIASAGVKLITALVKNLPAIITGIVKAIPRIISAIINGFGEGVSKMVDVGKNLLTGLGNGLIAGAKGVVEKAKQVAGNVLGAIKGFFGVSSPSRVFHEIGGYLVEGLAEGIDDDANNPVNSIRRLSNNISGAFDPSLAVNSLMYGAGSMYQAQTANPVFANSQTQNNRNLTVILELDRMQMGKAVYTLNNEETQRVGVKLAGGYA